MVLDASPVNLQTGEPGLGVARAALSQGISVVLANKAPLVLAFDELHDLAARTGAGLAFSATVCGALPVINIGRRDLIAADVHSLRGIFNSTSNFILGEMARGRSYGEALAEAQERGIAEADPSLDVEGWDTANKLVIIANSFLVNAGEGSGSGSGNGSVGLADVQVQGITELGSADLQVQLAQGRTIKLVASAQRRADGGYDLSVAPTVLEQDEFLGRCDGWEMGIEIHSDLYGRMYHKIWEREPLPTAAAMLRDAVDIVNRVSSIE
jgi:homoserine dehydrogenase